MKTSQSGKAILMAITILIIVGTTLTTSRTLNIEEKYVSLNKIAFDESELYIPSTKLKTNKIENISNQAKKVETLATTTEETTSKETKEEIVYDGMTLNELSDKLNRSLNDTLAGQGSTFASYTIELGIDPYLALAIVLHETGCTWSCSTLLKQCNNVGGMKAGGSGTCNGSNYASFDTLEEGIKAFVNNLYKNYFSQGLNTPETIGPKYAESTTWASQVNNYINKIKEA